MNRVHQPRSLIVLGLNAWMGTAAGADELVEVPYRRTSEQVAKAMIMDDIDSCKAPGTTRRSSIL